MRWYVLQVAGGQEIKIRDVLLRSRLPAKVPRELCQIRRGGKWHLRTKTLMPGYVFVGCDCGDGPDLSAEVYYTATSLPGAIRFLGTPKPQAITKGEAVLLLLLAPDGEPLPPSRVRRSDGAVLDGPLLPMRDRVIKVDRHRRLAKVSIPMLGEDKPLKMSIVIEDDADGRS